MHISFFFFFGDLVTLHKSKEEGISKGLKAQKMTIWRGPSAIRVGMAMGRVISGTRPVPPLMGWDIIFLNWYGTGLGFFFKPGAGAGRVRVLPHPAPPRPDYI